MRGVVLTLWILFFVWMGTEALLSSIPAKAMPPLGWFPQMDKVLHVGMFGLGGCLFCMALRGSVSWAWPGVMLLTIVVISAYGWIDELHQLSTPGRSGADVFDWLADTTGGILAAFFIWIVYGFYQSRRSREAR